MLRIRLQRVGRKHEPTFRVVLTDRENSTKSGRFKEILGSYDPRVNKPVIDAERVKYWIRVGAKPTDTMHNLLISQKIIEGKKINVLPRKSPVKAAVEEEAEALKGGGEAAAVEAAVAEPETTETPAT